MGSSVPGEAARSYLPSYLFMENEGNLGDNDMKVLPDMNRIPWLLVLIAVVAAIAIYRIGFHRSVPGFNYEAVTSLENSRQQEPETGN